MNTIKGYGAIIRNTPIDEKNTIAYQELTTLGLDGKDIHIDIVRADIVARQKLEYLIRTLSEGDRIDMYSIDTLLQGNRTKAVEYYADILNKGIGMLIFDFSGASARLSPFSTYRFGDRSKGEDLLVKKNPPYDIMIADFSRYVETAEQQRHSGGLRTEKRLNISNAFKDIYFAYESYQIDQDTTLELVKEYCGLGNKLTFRHMVQDYERTLGYVFDFEQYAEMNPEILNLPKRCGGLPAEYSEILDYANTLTDIPKRHLQIDMAMSELGFIAGYQVFKRWELVAKKTPRPRKPILNHFDVKEFEKRHEKYKAE